MSQSRFQLEVLGNGLSVLLCETHRAPVAEIQIWARVGSADEAPGEAGLAHFHEHMLFKGTGRRGLGEVAGDVEGAGGRINAYTTFDTTVYHATLPSDRLPLGLDVLSDAVLHSSFEPDEITREIGVVLEEIRRGEDSPHHVLGNAVFAEAYREHPYRAPILGTSESVAGFDRASVRAFFERWYSPEQLVVVAVGDFEAPRFLETVRETFADVAAGTALRARPAEPPQTGLRSVIVARPFERVNVELVWPVVGLAHPDAALLDLLLYVLGSGDSSRLARRVRQRDGHVERIDASCYTPLDPGLASVSLETSAERTPAAIEASVAEVERVRVEPVSLDELEKARANFLALEHFERESVGGIAQKTGSFAVLAGDPEAEHRYLDTLRSATQADLLRVAHDYLGSDRITVGAVIPDTGAPALDADRVANAVDGGVRSVRRTFTPPRAGTRTLDVQRYELACGVQLLVTPRRDVPVVAVRAAFGGGLLAETPKISGISSFLSSMWLRGTRTRSSADFALATESLAAEIDGFSGRNSLGLTLETPSEWLTRSLELFTDVLLEPALDPEELERERRETLAAIERREDRLGQRAYLLFAETHFREHPYRMSMLGSAEAVSLFDRDALVAHHRRLINARNAAIAVAGDVDPDDLALRLSALLAEFDATAGPPPTPAVESPPREIREAFLEKDRAQAHLVIGFRGLTVDDEDRFALEVISQLLAGQGGRLFLELRDRRSLAYAVNAMNVEGLAPGTFTTYIATSPDKYTAARDGLLDELRGLLDSPPGDAEIDRARRFLVGNFAIDQQRNAAHAAHVALDALYGLGPEAARDYPERIESISKDDIVRVAHRVIDLDAYTLAAVRPPTR